LKNKSGHTTFEECCPYRGIRGIDWNNIFGGSSEIPPAWEDYIIPISHFSVEVNTLPPQKPEDTRIKLKTVLLNHGPVGLRIYSPGMNIFTVGSLRYWGLRHTDSGDYYSGDAPLGIFNQAVVLVGWQDDPSVAAGGYWIIKNSWGSSWGCEGFFNLEYGSLNSDCGYYIIVDYDADSYNWPPVGKPTLVAPSYAKAGEEYPCIFSSIDPEQNQEGYKGQIYYNFSWGDSTYSDWLGPFESGEECRVSHVWTRSGMYKIKVKVKDDPNGDGDLSDGKETDWLPT